jgi:hypothetical protein
MEGSLGPAVVTQLISNPPFYTHDGANPASFARVQFRIFGGQHAAGAQAMEDVGQALRAFFATLPLSSRPAGLVQPNFSDQELNMPYQQQDGMTNEKVIDLIVFVDDSI